MFVGVVAHKQELFENIARLRLAGRRLPGSSDIAAVRVSLERELGETVSRRLAARILGVSHTALERWIRTGDLPVIYALSGRFEIPVPALLDLYEEMGAAGGDAPRNTLAKVMTRRRDAAKRMSIRQPSARDRSPHGRPRALGLAYHDAVARRLSEARVEEARHVLFRWRRQGRIDESYYQRWDQLLQGPLSELRDALSEESPEADDLRQNSPFAGMLSEPERQRIVREGA